ncbi:MAG: hypothetical protein IJJ43_06780 [Oscillospiraceae bacterium]|nr:hypothetical protein [Oscillospiraceae bacterium]
MTNDKYIPIVVGVTGHRTIREQDRSALYAAVKHELKKLQELCPHSPLVLLCSLAEGGDLLCADAAEDLGIALIAALPTEREVFVRDLSPAALERFEHHCARAEDLFVIPPTEALPENGPTRAYLFRQAGIYISAHSHVLLALWDGGEGTQAACGTAEAVDFALNGSYRPVRGTPLRSGGNEAVIHVFTPRGEHCEEAAGTVHVYGRSEAIRDILQKTDDYNRLAGTVEVTDVSRLPESAPDDPVLLRTERISLIAGKLSGLYAGKFRRALALIAAASAVLTFAFLMYDEAHLVWMIFICGIMLLTAWQVQRYASRSDCHRRYIEFRALAECLRVQTYLRYAGAELCTSELLSWSQQTETAWILDALCALEVGCPPKAEHDIRECWVEEQRRYHHAAKKRSRRSLGVSERVVRFALILSVALYLAALLFELLFGRLLFPPISSLANADLCRTILKILLGTISAVTLFTANYYGRLSLPRTLSDHQKMERFYTKMSRQLLERSQTPELLSVLAREELIENANWCSYQRDNAPNFNL